MSRVPQNYVPPQQKSVARILGGKNEYPLWVYHRTLPAVVVQDWDEEQARKAEGYDISADERADIDRADGLAKMLLQSTTIKGKDQR